jgi:hypothetical protein
MAAIWNNATAIICFLVIIELYGPCAAAAINTAA